MLNMKQLNIDCKTVDMLINTVISSNPEVFDGNPFLVEMFVDFAKLNMTDEVAKSLSATAQVLKDKYEELTSGKDGKYLVVTEFNHAWHRDTEWCVVDSLEEAAKHIENNYYYEYKGLLPSFSIWKDKELLFRNDAIEKWRRLHVTFKKGNGTNYTTVVKTEHSTYEEAIADHKTQVANAQNEYGDVRRVLDVRPQGNIIAETIVQLKGNDTELVVTLSGHYISPIETK